MLWYMTCPGSVYILPRLHISELLPILVDSMFVHTNAREERAGNKTVWSPSHVNVSPDRSSVGLTVYRTSFTFCITVDSFPFRQGKIIQHFTF